MLEILRQDPNFKKSIKIATRFMFLIYLRHVLHHLKSKIIKILLIIERTSNNDGMAQEQSVHTFGTGISLICFHSSQVVK